MRGFDDKCLLLHETFFWSVFFRFRTESQEIFRPYSVRMRKETDQKNCECRHFSHSVCHHFSVTILKQQGLETNSCNVCNDNIKHVLNVKINVTGWFLFLGGISCEVMAKMISFTKPRFLQNLYIKWHSLVSPWREIRSKVERIYDPKKVLSRLTNLPQYVFHSRYVQYVS